MSQTDVSNLFMPIGISFAFSSLWGILFFSVLLRKIRILEANVNRLESAYSQLVQSQAPPNPIYAMSVPPHANQYPYPYT